MDGNWGGESNEKGEYGPVPGGWIQQSEYLAQRNEKAIGHWDQLPWKLWMFYLILKS